MGVPDLIKRVELPQGSQWINEDVRPVEAERRTWGFPEFNNYWLLINCNLATYLTGSALIPIGLTWWQAIISIVLGNLLATGATLLTSMAGAYYHIGFPVVSRSVWGVWGAQFTVWNRIFLSLVWYGFTSWVGGECINLILLSWDPKLEVHIPNHMPAETGMTTAGFVSYFIFCLVSLPFIWIKPYRLQTFFYVSSTITMVFFVVILIWSLATMDGFGDTMTDESALPNTGSPNSVAWLMVYGIMSTIGSIAAGILNQNDYARLATRPRHAILGQAVAFPVYGILASVIGILVTAATQKRLDNIAYWNPPSLFMALLAKNPSSGTRAACFFAGFAMTVAQIGNNVPGNALAGGIDLSSVFPRYINIRRGAFITAILSPIVNPWRLVNTATVFLTVLSGYGVFLAPMTGLMVASYIVVFKQKLNTDDLYLGSKESIYWYNFGVNWRAPVAWIVGFAPCLPGFIAAINGSSVPDGATELYYINYLYGFFSSALVFVALHKLVPDARVDAFVRDSPSATTLQQESQERWDMVDKAQLLEMAGGHGSHQKEPKTTTSQVML